MARGGRGIQDVFSGDLARREAELAKEVAALRQQVQGMREWGASKKQIDRALLELYILGGLQGWRDHLHVARHLIKRRLRDEAREVLADGLMQLGADPDLYRGRLALQQQLEALDRADEREATAARAAARDRKARAREPSAAQARRPSKTPARGAGEPSRTAAGESSKTAGEPSKTPAREATATPPVKVEVELRLVPWPELAAALGAAGPGPAEAGASGTGPGAGDDARTLRLRELALRGSRVSIADRFDHLLCLEGLRDVERMPHQIETARRVLRVLRGRALLADEVGLGKTIEAGLILAEYLQRELVQRVLIIVPAALVGQWREELRDKFGVEVATTEDADFRADPAGFWRRHDLIVASLEAARRGPHRAVLTERQYDLVIVDEAHRLKRSQTAGYKLVDGLHSRFLLLLTATPVENDLGELFNVINLLRPGQLATLQSFRRRFVSRGDPTVPRDTEALRELLAEVMIRNTRALVDLRLPPRFASTVRCAPTPAEAELRQRVEALVAARYDRPRERLALATLLQEVDSSPLAAAATIERMLGRADLDPALDEALRPLLQLGRAPIDTAKGGQLLALLRAAAAAGDKCVVFTRFRETLAHLQRLLEQHQVPCAIFAGGMRGADKDAAVAALAGRVDVLLATEVGGEGRNLQVASTLINYDLPWNPMRLEQRIGRLHRIGQTREVRIHNICAAGSAEDRILDVLDRRINMFELVIGELDMILGRMHDERDFAERVLEIYGTASEEADLDRGFAALGDELAAARQAHVHSQRIDQLLFDRDFEV